MSISIYNSYDLLKTIAETQILNISLKNEALKWYGEYQGIYHLSPNKTNGKPSWQSPTHAIWSFEGRSNIWVIGNLSQLGESYMHQFIHGTKEGN